MSLPEDLLQERLEQLEAGAPLAACLTGLPESEVELLRLASLLREAPAVVRDSDTVTAQRAYLLRLAMKEKQMTDHTPPTPSRHWTALLPAWLSPQIAFAGAMALVLVVALAATLALWNGRQPDSGNEIAGVAPTATAETGVTGDPATAVPTLPGAAQAETAVPTRPTVAPAPTASPTPFHSALLPMITLPLVTNPQSVTVYDAQGLVEVQGSDGAWTAVSQSEVIAAGQRVRTGDLSGVTLAFLDGSQARLSANTEVSVDEVDARVDGPRTIVLTQWVGESDHEVVPRPDDGSRYEVRTPSGTGEARGTSFHVLVTPALYTTFSVNQGAVAVTSLNVTVLVVAGQLTVINPGAPPVEPAFRVTGEGEVSQTGATWTIAGQTFATTENTVIVGNPQVGDIVFVDGRLLADGSRVADRIVLLRPAPVNRFTITGPVETIGATSWTIAGQTIIVNETTMIENGIENGDEVRVEGRILPGGTLLAERINLVEPASGTPFHFVGVAQVIGADAWTVSGRAIVVNANTIIAPGLAVGDTVAVSGRILPDDTWLARAITPAGDGREFAFTGTVERLNPWRVSGVSFETRAWTVIEPGVGVGDRVRVSGRILSDGTWVAAEIERLSTTPGLQVVFVGTVASIDPWVVSGIPLFVNNNTVIGSNIVVGSVVRVTAVIQPDGTWLVTSIHAIFPTISLGCLNIGGAIVSVNGNQLVLNNWPTPITLENNIQVTGNLAPNNVVWFMLCVNPGGVVIITHIIVIYQPVIIITPPPVIVPQPPPSQGGGGSITICHRPSGNPNAAHTIQVDPAALDVHLGHGDTLGPCPGGGGGPGNGGGRDNDDDDDDD
jgi:hypothetical protein